MSIFLKKGKIKREKGLQSLLLPREFRTRIRRNPKKAKETVAPKKQAQTNSNKFPSLPTSSQTKSSTTRRALNQGRTLPKPVAIPEARSRNPTKATLRTLGTGIGRRSSTKRTKMAIKNSQMDRTRVGAKTKNHNHPKKMLRFRRILVAGATHRRQSRRPSEREGHLGTRLQLAVMDSRSSNKTTRKRNPTPIHPIVTRLMAMSALNRPHRLLLPLKMTRLLALARGTVSDKDATPETKCLAKMRRFQTAQSARAQLARRRPLTRGKM